MTATDAILNYAISRGGAFSRKGLLRHILSSGGSVNKRTIDRLIARHIASGKLCRTAYGEYMIAEDVKQEFFYSPSDKEVSLFKELKTQFPLLSICVWRPRILSAMMHHVPDIGYTFVDVEKDGIETVFNFLRRRADERRVLLMPSETECDRYLVGTDSIVVRMLVGQAPLEEVDGVTVPRLEKILVDAIRDNEMSFAGDGELYSIYESAFEKYNVNPSRLLRYASRRNRKEIVEQILKSISYDKP